MDTFFKPLKIIKEKSKQFFWAWIAYQCVKGVITTSFIWIPLFYSLSQAGAGQ